MNNTSETLPLNFDAFLSQAAALDGDDFSLHVLDFCKRIKSVSDSEQQLTLYFRQSELGFVDASSTLIKYIHPDKHEASSLSNSQKSIFADVTALILTVRVSRGKLSVEQIQMDCDDAVKVSRSCSFFEKDQSDYEYVKEMEQYCFTILYNRGHGLPRDWLDALTQQYHNLYVYITYWCKERNAVWLDDNLSLFRYHVELVKHYFDEKPNLKKVFEDFLKIGKTMITRDSQIKQLEGPEDKNQKSGNVFTHAKTVFFAALSVVFFAAGPVSWSAFVAFSVFRSVLAATEMFALEMNDRAHANRPERYAEMLNVIKNEFTILQNGIISLQKFEHRRHEERKCVKRENLKMLSSLIEKYKVLKAQADISSEDQLQMIELEEDIKETQVACRLPFFAIAQKPVTLPICATGCNSDLKELSSDSSDDSSSEIEIEENIRTFIFM